MKARLVVGFLVFAVIVTALLEIPIGLSQQSRQESAALTVLGRDAGSLAVLVSDALVHREPTRAIDVAMRYGRAASRGIVVMSGSTVVLATAPGERELAESAAMASVLQAARTRTVSGSTSGVSAIGAQYYVALPLRLAAASGHRPATMGVLLMTLPEAVVAAVVRNGWLDLVALGLAVLAVATLIGLFIAASLVRPLRRIEAAVDAIGAGRLDARAPASDGPPELRRLAASINASSARLIGLLEAQRAFTADASHQLRTPLAALRLRLENVARAGGPGDEGVAAAVDEVARLSRLVEALLDLARTEGRHAELVVVDVPALIEERHAAWLPFAEEQQIVLQTGVATRTGLAALAFPEALEQILDNLLANAVEATPPGGTVRIDAARVGESVELHVADTGPGIGPSDRARAFDRFWRGEHSSSDGSGLGLAIVQQLSRLCGGSAELREDPSGGVDATVCLQAARGAPDRAGGSRLEMANTR